MSLAVLRRGLRQHATVAAAVLAAVIGFELLVVKVVALIDTGAGLRNMIGTMLPPPLRALAFEQLGIASFPGAVAFGFRHPLSIVAASALMILLGSLPAGERESGWLDLVLSRPVRRTSYLAAHLALVILAALALATALLAGAAWGLAISDGPGELPWTRYIPAAAALAPLLLLIGSYTLLFASEARRRGTAVARAVGFTLLFYWLDFMGGFWDTLRYARYFSPFHYFDPTRASIGEGLGWRDPLVLTALAAACALGAILNFRRQDL